MLSFIILLVLSLAIAFFAGQNTTPVTISFSDYQLPTIPLYTVIIGAMLIGFFVSWLVSLVDSVFTIFTLRGKDSRIQATERKIAKLNDQIHELEIENARLKGEHHEPIIKAQSEDDAWRPSIFDRIRHAIR